MTSRAPAQTDPNTATPSGAEGPHCARCGYDLSGASALRADSTGPVAIVRVVCPECGSATEIDTTRPIGPRGPVWSFEHRRGPRAFAGTLWRLIAIGPLWRGLRPEHEIRWLRLGWFAVLVMLLGQAVVSVVCGLSAYGLSSGWARQNPATFWWTGRGPVADAFAAAAISHWWPWVPDAFGGYEPADRWMWAWPALLAVGVGLPAVLWTMVRKGVVGPRHALRAMVYSVPVGVVVGLVCVAVHTGLTLAQGIDDLRPPIGTPQPWSVVMADAVRSADTWAMQPILAFVLLYIAWLARFWWATLGSYLGVTRRLGVFAMMIVLGGVFSVVATNGWARLMS